METTLKERKAVEYLELIYDLIFVYIIGRNNSLIQQIKDGFISLELFFIYVLVTLAVIQIWNYSTFYINIYGRNGVRDHIFLFLNMFLIYFMADGTTSDWQVTFYKYNFAWALILFNTGIQHFIELRNHQDSPWESSQLKLKGSIILAEALLVVLHILVYRFFGISIAWLPILFGITAMFFFGKAGVLAPVEFAHLCERAMLYVVFTFGEMIIAVAPYFTGAVTWNNLYFASMTFLIVTGLFLSYGTLYNKIIDRQIITNGVNYMAIHIFLIFALNNISNALDFMRDESISLLPKTLFLAGSFVIYYIFLFSTGNYIKTRRTLNKRFALVMGLLAASFIGLMLLFRNSMYINIAVTLLYVYGIYYMIAREARIIEQKEGRTA